MNILYPDRKKREQDKHRLLLIPCNIIDNRKVVDVVNAEEFLELKCCHDYRK